MGFQKKLEKLDFSHVEKRKIEQFIKDINLINPKLLKEKREMLEKIVNNEKISEEEKAKKVYDLLFRLRYPILSRTLEKFDNLANKIYRRCGVKFVPPKFFEGDNINVSFSFKNIHELFQIFKKIKKHKNEIKKLFTVFTK